MKLDKIKFAQVVAFIVDAMRMGFDDESIRKLDEMIDIDVSDTVQVYPLNSQIDDLMRLMVEGQRKIETIKVHRSITGMGLKESKDAVERYWVSKRDEKPDVLQRMRNVIADQENGLSRDFVLKDFTQDQLDLVGKFINSFGN